MATVGEIRALMKESKAGFLEFLTCDLASMKTELGAELRAELKGSIGHREEPRRLKHQLELAQDRRRLGRRRRLTVLQCQHLRWSCILMYLMPACTLADHRMLWTSPPALSALVA